MKKICLFLLLIFSYNLTACSSENVSMEDSSSVTTTEDELDSDNAIQEPPYPDLSSILGFPVLLPENPNWIKNVEYRQTSENNLEIYYYDDILGTDCILYAGNEGVLNLSEDEYDESLEETWTGNTASGQTIYVRVQHSSNGKVVLATWEYNDYNFAIQGNRINDVVDTDSIPKTALYVISLYESE